MKPHIYTHVYEHYIHNVCVYAYTHASFLQIHLHKEKKTSINFYPPELAS